MKKLTLVLLLPMLFLLTACVNRPEIKASIISLYRENETLFTEAASSGDFSTVATLNGVESVYHGQDYVSIFCRGTGFASNSCYFGLYYSATDNLCAQYGSLPADELAPAGNGYRYQQPDGDNTYYVEPLGNHYFYYEETY